MILLFITSWWHMLRLGYESRFNPTAGLRLLARRITQREDDIKAAQRGLDCCDSDPARVARDLMPSFQVAGNLSDLARLRVAGYRYDCDADLAAALKALTVLRIQQARLQNLHNVLTLKGELTYRRIS